MKIHVCSLLFGLVIGIAITLISRSRLSTEHSDLWNIEYGEREIYVAPKTDSSVSVDFGLERSTTWFSNGDMLVVSFEANGEYGDYAIRRTNPDRGEIKLVRDLDSDFLPDQLELESGAILRGRPVFNSDGSIIIQFQ